ncbi:MAG: hypothetical protein WAW37_02140 [Syntrophobacteraceae bacterium]
MESEPQIIKKNNKVAYLIEGFSVDNPSKPEVVRFGILQVDVMKRHDRGQNSALAQFDSIVAPGLISVQHVFRGLNRPLFADGSMEADKQKLAYTWRPVWDFEWPDPFGRPRKLPRPMNCVFVVIVSKNMRHLEEWPEVYGWIDRWNWVDEDPGVPGSPLNWSSRYGEKLFTQKGV